MTESSAKEGIFSHLFVTGAGGFSEAMPVTVTEVSHWFDQ
jgi:hypothetical protein